MSELIDRDALLKKAVPMLGPSGKTIYNVVFTDDILNAKPIEPTTKNNLGVDCIDKTELLKAMDTWDKFGNDPNEGLILLSTPALQNIYVPYVKYDDMVNCVKSMPQEPRKGHWIEHPHEAGPNWEYSMYECSECHGWAEDDSDYCPDCGAKMENEG